MKEHKRNIFPGSNTPYGFHSYYNYILEQNKAEKIFCLKGGPGTGKSTMMKEIGESFEAEGEAVDYLWCSSDPDSLDGIILKGRNTAIVDGTAPHVVEPKNPGAVDRIVDLGSCWNESILRLNRDRIMECNEETGAYFKLAYGYLRCAGEYYRFISGITEDLVTDSHMKDVSMQLNLALDNIPCIKRAESKIKNDCALGREHIAGSEKRFFADAITPLGIKSGLDSLIDNIGRLIILKAPACFDTGKFIKSASERIRNAGFDIELSYCPMEPEKRPEHVISQAADVAVITENEYHSVSAEYKHSRKTRVIEIKMNQEGKKISDDMMVDLRVRMLENINKAVQMLAEAKKHHDELEDYYIPAMDFDKVQKIKCEIVNGIKFGDNIRK